MNKGAIQKFAIWARNELIAQVSQRAYQYGIDESGFGDASADTLNGRLLTAEEKSQRQELIKQIKEKGYKQVMEEVAYTWFNRFIALRFMEVNNYLPSHIRVFSDASGAFKPEILNDVLHLDLPGLNSGKVAAYIESNDTEALYRYLLLTQCNALNNALPVMFERMGGYTEMLLPNNILRQDSVLGHMVSDIPEEDWQDAVQIIGWLYQYYNTELKDDTFAQLKKNVKITKERIPAATQLFTPDWIVRYMVENSLGRLWLEGHPNAELHDGWKYYLDEAEQERSVEDQLAKLREEYKTIKPEDIKVIDPCMGSGHILVYAFDVLMQIYTSAGWDQREAAQSILKNNLYGLDIDDRAAQLAYFAVMMKARQYDRRLLTRSIQPNIYSIRESNGIQTMTIEYFHNNDPKLKADIENIVTEMRDAKEYGSILNITPADFAGLYARFDEIRKDINMMQMPALEELLPLVKCAELLAQKYDVVVTNPPYLGSSRFSTKLNDFVIANYPDVKADLSMVMYKHALRDMCQKNGFVSFITTTSWMFLSSFEKLRSFVLAGYDFESLVDFGTELFEGKVGHNPIVAWVNRKSHTDHAMTGIRLVDYCYSRRDEKETEFFNKKNYHYPKQSNFSKIPGSPVAYWVSKALIQSFIEKKIDMYGSTNNGFTTGDNERFLRVWSEVQYNKICFDAISRNYAQESQKRWFPYNKGGAFRKWYGNNEYILNWFDDGADVKAYGHLVPRSLKYQFMKSISWSKISSSVASFKVKDTGTMFDVAGLSLFPADNKNFYYLLALCNSSYAQKCLDFLSPTLNYETGHIASIPVIIDAIQHNVVDSLTIKCVQLSKTDWDSAETSWDFKRNPLV